MATLTATNISKLNKMNRAAQDAQLGTKLNAVTSASATQNAILGFSGSRTVTAGEMNGSRVIITTGLSAVSGWFVSADRSGSPLAIWTASGSVAGTIEVRSATNYVGGSAVATGDKLTYMGFA